MKKILALLLVLAICLSLPVAAAEPKTPTEPVLTTANGNLLNRTPTGGYQFDLLLDGEPLPPEQIRSIGFSSKKLGSVWQLDEHSGPDLQWGIWMWDTGYAWPNQKGLLLVELTDGRTCSMEVSTGDQTRGFYTDPSNRTGSALPQWGGVLQYDPAAPFTLYFDMGTDKLVELRTGHPGVAAILGEDGIARITVPQSWGDYGLVEFEAVTASGDLWKFDLHLIPRTESGIVTTGGRGNKLQNLPNFGTVNFRVYVQGEELQPWEVQSCRLTNDKLGRISEEKYGPAPWGRWLLDMGYGYPNQSGELIVTVEGKEYAVPVSTGPAVIGCYEDPACTEESYVPFVYDTPLTYVPGVEKQLYIKLHAAGKITKVTDNSMDVDAVQTDEKTVCLTIPVNGTGPVRGVRVNVTAELENQRTVTVVQHLELVPDRNAGKLCDSHQVTPEEILTGFDPQTITMDPVPFQIPGQMEGTKEQFYLRAAAYAYGMPSLGQTGDVTYERVMEDGNLFEINFRVGFWKDLGEGNFVEVRDKSTLDRIHEALGDSVRMTLYAMDGTYETDSWKQPAEYPALYRAMGEESWLEPINVRFGIGSGGTWILKTSCVADGRLVEDHMRIIFKPTRTIFYRPDPNGDVVKQINQHISEAVLQPDERLIVTIPEGQHWGSILLPEGKDIWLEGESNRAAVHGGIICRNSNALNIGKLHLIGAGKDEETWPAGTGHGLDGTENRAFYGPGMPQTNRCDIEGYAVALESTMWHGTGNVDSWFHDNGVAIRINSDAPGGNPETRNCVFQNNGIALDFQHIKSALPTTFFHLRYNQFLGNEIDVQNSLGRNIYLPGNYFAAKEGTHRPCQTNDSSHVMTWPRAADPEFTGWVEDKSPVVCTAFAGEFPIAAAQLDGSTIRVMEEQKELARLTFPAAQTASLLGNQTDGFVPMVTLDRDGSDLLFTMEDPLGRTPMVTIPCGWQSATVLGPDQQPLEAVTEQGEVRFPAAAGGTYRLKNSGLLVTGNPEVQQQAGRLTVTIPVSGERDGYVAVACCSKQGQLLQLQLLEAVPGKNSLTGTLEPEQQAAEVRIIAMDEAYAPVQASMTCPIS